MYISLGDRLGSASDVTECSCGLRTDAGYRSPLPINLHVVRFQRRVLKGRDERLKRMTDLLSSVRLVKMYAWEDAYMEAVNRSRDKEMVPVFLVNLLDGFIDSLYSSSSSVVRTLPLHTSVLNNGTKSFHLIVCNDTTLRASLTCRSIAQAVHRGKGHTGNF